VKYRSCVLSIPCDGEVGDHGLRPRSSPPLALLVLLPLVPVTPLSSLDLLSGTVSSVMLLPLSPAAPLVWRSVVLRPRFYCACAPPKQTGRYLAPEFLCELNVIVCTASLAVVCDGKNEKRVKCRSCFLFSAL